MTLSNMQQQQQRVAGAPVVSSGFHNLFNTAFHTLSRYQQHASCQISRLVSCAPEALPATAHTPITDSQQQQPQHEQRVQHAPARQEYERATPAAPTLRHRQKHASAKRQLAISWAGSGLYFFWQLGAMKYLAENYDLSRVPMVGASGGSIAAALAACKVPADAVIRRAYELSLQHNVWENPGALMGEYGGLVERFLEEMLPEDAHELCRGRVTVVVTTLPDMRQVGISDFKDKRDLVQALMASAHVPLVLDAKLTRDCRGKACVDGSFPDFFWGNCELLTMGGGAVLFDYFDDKLLKRQGRMDMLQITTFETLQERMELGYRYAAQLHEAGTFHGFHLEEVLLPGNGHVREVMAADRQQQQELQPEQPLQQQQEQQLPLQEQLLRQLQQQLQQRRPEAAAAAAAAVRQAAEQPVSQQQQQQPHVSLQLPVAAVAAAALCIQVAMAAV